MKPVYLLAFIILISSCFEPDLQINSPSTNEVLITSDIFQNQSSYLNLSRYVDGINSENKKWHLKFQNAKNSWSIYLNPLENVAIHQTTITNFKSVDSNFNLVGLKWLIDAPTSKGAYPAFGPWGDFNYSVPQSYKNVYILRLKNDITAKFFKVQVLDASDNAYRIRYASLNEKVDHIVTINKDDAYAHSYLRIADEPFLPKAEPKKSDWDICLSFVADSIKKHTNLPYLPTINNNYGVFQALLINNEYNNVAIDSIHSFEEVNFFDIQTLNYKSPDQLFDVLIEWDETTLKAKYSDKNFLILKREDVFYAIKATEIKGEYPTQFELTLKIKKL